MKVKHIKVKNILGIKEFDFKPGKVTEITGANGTGKTSALEACKSILGAGSRANLLYEGSEKGEVVFVIDDDSEIKLTATPAGVSTTVKHPTFGKISRPAEYLKKLTDALSVNPVEFLTAKPKDRVDTLLAALPMQIEENQIGFVPADILQFSGVSLDDHAMVVLDGIRRAMRDTRTGVNRSLKDKQATARHLTETLPEAPPDGDWQSQLAAAEAEYKDLRIVTHAALQETAKETNDTTSAARTAFERAKDEIKARADAEITRIRAEAEQAIEEQQNKLNAAICAAVESEQQKRRAMEVEYRPKEAELKERIGRARAMVEQETKAAETRKLAAQMEEEARNLAEESARLTDGLEKLDALKSSLLSSLPIPGLEVKDGEIYVDGIPFDRVNESMRVKLAIEIAKLRAGELGLIVVDGLECMDSATFAEFEKSAAESGLQFVISRVSDGPLEIREVA